MKNDYNQLQIEIDYGHLADGQTSSGQVCPACKGGASEEKSLSVSRRDGVLLWNCHRASCSFRGNSGLSTGGSDQGSGAKPVRERRYIKTTPLNQATVKFLATKFGIPEADFRLAGCGWTGDADGNYSRRVSFPIFGPDSRKRGEMFRSYQGGKPKSIIQLHGENDIAAAWYKWKRRSKYLILVEDQVSAIKVAPIYHSLALLGTNLSEAKVLEIMYNNEYDNVYLCLDNDATHDAIRQQLKWGGRLKGLQVRGLEKDIKDMSKEEFNEFMRRFEED